MRRAASGAAEPEAGVKSEEIQMGGRGCAWGVLHWSLVLRNCADRDLSIGCQEHGLESPYGQRTGKEKLGACVCGGERKMKRLLGFGLL